MRFRQYGIKAERNVICPFIWNNRDIIVGDKTIYYSNFATASLWYVEELGKNSTLIAIDKWKEIGIKGSDYVQ